MSTAERIDTLDAQLEQEIEELERIAADATEAAQRAKEYLAELRSIKADIEGAAIIETNPSGFSVTPFLNDVRAEQAFLMGGSQ